MKSFLFISILLLPLMAWSQEEVPYRAEEDFKLKLDYDFKVKSYPDQETINYVEGKNLDPLPHLTIFISILNKKGLEEKVRIFDNRGGAHHTAKIKEAPIKLVLGFTDDMKEQITPHVFYINVTTKKREILNRIVLEVQKDGTFLVNGKKNGKL